MDIIRFYLLPNSTTLKLWNQKYEYVAGTIKNTSYIYFFNFIIGYRISMPRILNFKNDNRRTKGAYVLTDKIIK